MAAAHISQRLGMIPAELVERQGRLLEKLGLPTHCTDIDKQAVLTAMKLDKKVQKKATRWVLLEGWAVLCIHVPMSDTSLPTKNKR